MQFIWCLQTCRYADHTDVKCHSGTTCCNAVCAHYQSPPNDSLQVRLHSSTAGVGCRSWLAWRAHNNAAANTMRAPAFTTLQVVLQQQNREAMSNL